MPYSLGGSRVFGAQECDSHRLDSPTHRIRPPLHFDRDRSSGSAAPLPANRLGRLSGTKGAASWSALGKHGRSSLTRHDGAVDIVNRQLHLRNLILLLRRHFDLKGKGLEPAEGAHQRLCIRTSRYGSAETFIVERQADQNNLVGLLNQLFSES